jgi:hypothetical protein
MNFCFPCEYLFFEALGIKLVSFLRCKDSSNARELTLQQRGRLEV